MYTTEEVSPEFSPCRSVQGPWSSRNNTNRTDNAESCKAVPLQNPSPTQPDFNQADEKRGVSFLWDILRKFWLWECAACNFSLICLMSILGVLVYENGHQLDEWHFTIPPNTVIAFIVLLAKRSLVMVLSSILSQLKWLNFENAPNLKQLKNFDRARRGPWSSFLFLWISKGTTILASSTAFLALLALLLDPFVQIALSFPSEFAVDSIYRLCSPEVQLSGFWTCRVLPTEPVRFCSVFFGQSR